MMVAKRLWPILIRRLMFIIVMCCSICLFVIGGRNGRMGTCLRARLSWRLMDLLGL